MATPAEITKHPGLPRAARKVGYSTYDKRLELWVTARRLGAHPWPLETRVWVTRPGEPTFEDSLGAALRRGIWTFTEGANPPKDPYVEDDSTAR
jgi:hypothetical protein